MESEFILITGCMFAGKSKYLIENYGDKDVEAYKPSTDTRDIGAIKSRDLTKTIPCRSVATLTTIELKKQTILIDEFQFFNSEELKDFVIKCKREHRTIVMAGLNLLANGEEWSSYTAVRPMCDKLILLRAKCSVCGEPADFTELVKGQKDQKIQIEGKAIYEPRCSKHFNGGRE